MSDFFVGVASITEISQSAGVGFYKVIALVAGFLLLISLVDFLEYFRRGRVKRIEVPITLLCLGLACAALAWILYPNVV